MRVVGQQPLHRPGRDPGRDPLTQRQRRVLQALARAEALVLGTDDLAGELELPTGPLLVTLRSLQRGGLLRAVPPRTGTAAAWMPTALGLEHQQRGSGGGPAERRGGPDGPAGTVRSSSP